MADEVPACRASDEETAYGNTGIWRISYGESSMAIPPMKTAPMATLLMADRLSWREIPMESCQDMGDFPCASRHYGEKSGEAAYGETHIESQAMGEHAHGDLHRVTREGETSHGRKTLHGEAYGENSHEGAAWWR